MHLMKGKVLLLFTIGLTFSLAACTSSTAMEAQTPTPIPTSIVPTRPVYEVQRGDVIREFEFSGRISPIEEKELFFRESGYIKNVFVSKGDMVTAGQVIAELENLSDLARQKALSDFQVRLAELDLADANTSLEMLELSLPDAATLQAEALQNVIEAETALQTAQAAYSRTQSPTSRVANELELARIALENAQAEQARLGSAPFPSGYAQELILRQNAVERARIYLEISRLNLEDLEDAISDSQIIAPFDGQVLFLGLSEGRLAEAFERAVIVADTTELEVRAELNGAELQGLTPGMTVQVELFNAPGIPTEGLIRQLPSFSSPGDGSASEADIFTRVQLNIPPTESGFKLNDRVRIRVILEQKEDVLWLPPQAVRTFEGRNFVVIQDESGQRRIDVKLGVRTGDRVEIVPVEDIENLIEGQVVIGP
jgi:multidrug efflux pump subunit AcrA (membrane-fusion protein)